VVAGEKEDGRIASYMKQDVSADFMLQHQSPMEVIGDSGKSGDVGGVVNSEITIR